MSSCHRPPPAPAPGPHANPNADVPPTPPPSNQIPPVAALKTPIPLSPEDLQLREAVKLDARGDFEGALAGVNAVLQDNPKSISALSLRGEIYSKKKQWDLAQKDYEAILKFDDKNVPSKFNLSELKFMQKDYDHARPGFVELETDKEWGDLAAYRIYLCDLFGGHSETAQGELDAFNKSGSNPSFYFGNAAWHFYNKQPDEGKVWLNRGRHIYAPWKASLYASSLEELGFVPAPPPK